MTPKIYHKEEHRIRKEFIDPDAIFVVETLQNAGHTAYIVGGSVRDLLLSHKPKDFDISTSASPEQTKLLFPRCLLIGRRFRLAHVRFGRKIIEVATFRQGAEDDSLIITDNIWGSEEEDVLRRDFTINGLFYDPVKETLIDYVNGYEDAAKCHLRTIGNAYMRFKQDPVRMIRLLKFRARFGLFIDKDAIDALLECRHEILKSSKPRVLEEILRMMESGASYPFIRLLAEHGILNILLPKIAEFLESHEGGDIYTYLQEIDRMIVVEEKILERSILLSALLFPIFQKYLHTLHEGRIKPMHFGEIHEAAIFMVRDVFMPVLFIPRKISSSVVNILATQYRFTPIEKKKRIQMRIPRIPDIDFAFDFFQLRTQIEPGLQKIYEEWNYYRRKAVTRRHHAP